MPFIAKDKSTDTDINILDYEHPRLDLKSGAIVCRFCGQEMYIRGGKDRSTIAHFVHKSSCESKVNIDYRRDQYPESIEHLMMKQVIASELRSHYSEYTEAIPKFEYAVKFGAVHRIIDVAMVFPMGWIIGHEVQLSKISIEELDKRTDDYAEAGIDVVWWFGGNANTEDNREWSCRRFGSVFYFDESLLPAKTLQPQDRPTY